MKRVLITGLTGKSGRVLAELLREKGCNLPYTLRVLVRTVQQEKWGEQLLPGAEIYTGNLENQDDLTEMTRNVDVLFHISGIHWSLPVVRAAADNGVRRMVLVHTTGIYSKYKAAGEEYRRIEAAIDALAQSKGISLTYLRPTMIYGTLDDRNMIQFIKMVDRFNPMPMVNHGRYTLQPVNYRDLGRAYMQVLEHLDETGEGKSYVLSGRDSLLLRALFAEIARCLGVSRRFLSVPFPLAYGGAWVVYALTFGKKDFREKVQRLCEDRSYPHEKAACDFGYDPMPFTEGLRLEVEEYLRQKHQSKRGKCE